LKKVVIIGNPNFTNVAGGAENQLIKLAQELSKSGYHVSFGSRAAVLERSEYYDSFSVPQNWGRPNGMLSLFLALRKIKPKAVICRVLDPLLIIYSLFCWILGAKLIYFSAHDWELTPRKDKRIKGWRWQLFRLGLQFCNTIFVQNETQYNGFRKLLWWKKGRVVQTKNLPLLNEAKPLTKPGDFFTWVGSYRPHKNADWVLKIAEQLPDRKFHLILHCKNKKDIEERFKQKAEKLKNLTFTPGVDREQVPSVYKESTAVLITSEGEGFPNVALESWSQGRAVISTPSNVLKELSVNEGVIITEDIDSFVDIIKETPIDMLEQIGINGHSYFKSNYSTKSIIENIQRYL
jgi:glycosyltransferase involved in cell wall biosynthesis